MDEITVDVLITFYNQEKYVDRAMQSVFSQKGNFRLNVLIGDDGSTDGTPKLLEQWKRSYPKQIRIFKMARSNSFIPGGFRAARNRLNLLSYSSSDYFIFLDGDDFFDDIQKIQKQINILEQKNNQDCVACGHAIDAVYEDGRRISFAPIKIVKEKYTLRDYWLDTYLSTDTILFRKEAKSAVPKTLVEDVFNDNGITFILLHKGKIYYIPEVMAVYSQTGHGIWTGEKKAVSLIREILLYDFIMSYDATLIFETRVRYYHVWKDLFELRREMNPLAMNAYLEEAKRNNLKFTQLWINYDTCGFFNKIFLIKEYVLTFLCRCSFKLNCLVGRYS